MQKLRSALLPFIMLTLVACSGGESNQAGSIDDWVAARQAELPQAAGPFEWNDLTVYENQIIVTYVSRESGLHSSQALTEDAAFGAVTEAVCQVSGIEAVWQARYEHYASVRAASGDVLYTVRTKSFDCCVLEASKTMSRQEAQNHCPYEE